MQEDNLKLEKDTFVIKNARNKEFNFEEFVAMFYDYFLYDFKIELEYSKIKDICSTILDSVREEIINLDVIYYDNKAVGFIIYQIDFPKSDWCQKEGLGFIRELYIKREFRGQGWSSILINHAETFLKDYGVEQIYLTSESTGLFWNKQGYEPTTEFGYKNHDKIYIKKIN